MNGKSSTPKGLGSKHGGPPKLPEIVGKDMLLAPQSQDATDGWVPRSHPLHGCLHVLQSEFKARKNDWESPLPWKEVELEAHEFKGGLTKFPWWPLPTQNTNFGGPSRLNAMVMSLRLKTESITMVFFRLKTT